MKSFAFRSFFALALASFTAYGADAPATPGTPSTAERNQLNNAMKKLVEQADPAAKTVFDKYPTFRLVPLNSASVPALSPQFAGRHVDFVANAPKGDIDILFMGDSITDFWRNPGNKPVFDQNFGSLKVTNFGIAGDTTQGVLWRLQNGEGQGYQPKAVMLMIGTNNTGPNSAAEIAEGITAVVQELRKDFPAAKILLLAIFPRGNPGDANRAKIAEINALISKLDDRQNVFYMDIGAKFLDANGVIARTIMADGLHPTAAGYILWAEAVKEPLNNLLTGGPAPAKSPLPAVATPTLLAPPVAAPATP